mgnify:CR=1 FL=1
MIPSFYKNKELQFEQSTELLEGRVLVLDEDNGAAVSGAVFQIEAVVLEQALEVHQLSSSRCSMTLAVERMMGKWLRMYSSLITRKSERMQ